MNEEVMEAVTPYLHRIKKSGGPNIQAICPFHEDPIRSTPSFSMNTDNGLWQCFGCGRAGNLRTFLREMKLPKSQIDSIIGPVEKSAKRVQRESRQIWRKRFTQEGVFESKVSLPEGLLGIYDYAPVKLLNDGFDEDLLRSIGIGYDRKKKRITFPLRDLEGNLIGISGRTVKPRVEPRYKVYQGGYRKSNGEWVSGDFGPEFDEIYKGYELNSRSYLWNAHRARSYMNSAPRGIPMIIVEGYKACIWVEQQGWPNVVATQGTTISGSQTDVLNHISDGPPILLLDGDMAGMIGRWKIGKKLKRTNRVVRVGTLPDMKSPDDCDKEQLEESITKAKRFERWLKEEWTTYCREKGVNVEAPLATRQVAGAGMATVG